MLMRDYIAREYVILVRGTKETVTYAYFIFCRQITSKVLSMLMFSFWDQDVEL